MHVIHSEDNMGIPHSLNMAIKTASSKWVAVQDADHLSMPHRLYTQLDFLRNNPEIELVGSYITCTPAQNRISKQRLKAEEKGKNNLVTSEQLYTHRFHGCHLHHGTVIYSKQLFIKCGGYNPQYRIAHDYDLFMKMLKHTKAVKIPEVLYQCRVDPNSVCRRSVSDTWKEHTNISTIQLYEFYKEKGLETVFSIMGSKSGYKYFIKNNRHITINKFINLDDENINVSKLNKNGVIILDHYKGNKFFNILIQNGFELGNNLFKMWNIYH